MATSTATVPATRPRTGWIDAAKGLAIALVVLTHAAVFAEAAGHGTGVWDRVNTGLAGLRMPLFFTVSGVLAGGALSRGWREVLGRKAFGFAWLFVVWLAVTTAFFATGLFVDTDQPSSGPEFLAALLHPHTELWYLYALALFFLLARALAPLPVGVQLVAATALSVLTSAGVVTTGSWAWDGMASSFVFFLAGHHARGTLQRIVPRLGVGGALAAWAAFAAASVAVSGLDLHLVPGLPLLRGALGVLAAGSACALLVRWWPRNPLPALGRATLPVYLTHVLFIAVLATAAEVLLPETTPFAVRLVLPLPVTVAVVVAGFLVQRPLRAVPGLLRSPALT